MVYIVMAAILFPTRFFSFELKSAVVHAGARKCRVFTDNAGFPADAFSPSRFGRKCAWKIAPAL
jgi:hypothetical protein